GVNQGTFAHELLAIEYAGWISPAFRLQVNQTFLDSTKPVSCNPPLTQWLRLMTPYSYVTLCWDIQKKLS
ncbi:KilA-N domain-containing protein, partial [Yersinia enterocolitica]